jgi:Ca2+-binding EF-hand superfamily protein
MDLVEDIYKAFKKFKTDPKVYLEGKDYNKDGVLSEVDLKVMVNDFCRLGFTEKEINTLVRRYEHPIKRNMIEIAPIIEDINSFKKKDLQEENKGETKPSKSIANSKTPIGRIETIKFSTRHPTNVPGWKSYSMKNTSCGRQGAAKKTVDFPINKHEELLEEIMKQTFINDMFVEDYFKQFSKHSDLEFEEFKKALAGINLDSGDADIKELYTAVWGKNKRAYINDIDNAVESTVKKNIEEWQKFVLDDVYSGIKSDPLIQFMDVFSKFEASASNKITYNQFVSTLEPKCLNIEACNLVFLAKRYCTKYDNEVYYKDLVIDLEKLSKNVDPTKEWLLEVWVNVQKSLVCKNDSLYKFFVRYADKDDRINKKEFSDAMRALNLNEIYDNDTIDNFYYYCDVNKSGVVSLNELQKTVRQYCTKDQSEFVEDIVEFIADRLKDKRIPFSDFEEDVEKLIDPKGNL